MTLRSETTGGTLIRGADAEVLRFPNDSTIWLLAEDLGVTTTLSADRSLLRAGTQGAQPHHHEQTTHLLFIVSGSLDLMLGDRLMRLEAGDAALIPAGVTHAFRATPDADADVFDVVTPGRSFDMFRQYAGDGSDRQRHPSDDFDTYPDDSTAWQTAMTSVGVGR